MDLGLYIIFNVSLLCFILYMYEIKRDIGRKSRFFSYALAFDAPLGGSRQNIDILFGTEKLQRCSYWLLASRR